MKMLLTVIALAVAAAIATGYTRSLIRRLKLAGSQDPYAASWWVEEIHCASPTRLRDRLAKGIALRFA